MFLFRQCDWEWVKWKITINTSPSEKSCQVKSDHINIHTDENYDLEWKNRYVMISSWSRLTFSPVPTNPNTHFIFLRTLLSYFVVSIISFSVPTRTYLQSCQITLALFFWSLHYRYIWFWLWIFVLIISRTVDQYSTYPSRWTLRWMGVLSLSYRVRSYWLKSRSHKVLMRFPVRFAIFHVYPTIHGANWPKTERHISMCS